MGAIGPAGSSPAIVPGDVLFAALYRAGLANQPRASRATMAWSSTTPGSRSRPSAAPPPANKPTTAERDTCAPWLHREVTLLRPTLRVVVALGAFAWSCWWSVFRTVYGLPVPSPRPRFGHGALWWAGGAPRLLGSYHVSQQNTFTGRLTPAMLDDVFARAKQLGGCGERDPRPVPGRRDRAAAGRRHRGRRVHQSAADGDGSGRAVGRPEGAGAPAATPGLGTGSHRPRATRLAAACCPVRCGARRRGRAHPGGTGRATQSRRSPVEHSPGHRSSAPDG